ncbi:hypothetical protein [Streptomyces sp. NPDC001536]|uniref:hypothetical protein n=1 Tax=Streptomyces sp. NPDC001536 TaxID=3364583 RepID=UPI0036BDA096
MLNFDLTTTSGRAIAELFRTWCSMGGNDPDSPVDGGDWMTAVNQWFESLGLDVHGSASQVDETAGQHVQASGHGDVTPSQYEVPTNLLEDLREALLDWFDGNSDHLRPRAVSFHITDGYEDGPAWDTSGPTFHYDSDPDREERRDIPVDRLPDVDFERTFVADALIEISDFERPQPGDTLRIDLPA